MSAPLYIDVPHRILYTGRRSIGELVSFYIGSGNIPGAALLLYIAVKKKVSLQELIRVGEKISKMTGELVTRVRVGSFLTTWSMHRFVESAGRGVYTVGPMLDLSDLEEAKRKLSEYINVDELLS